MSETLLGDMAPDSTVDLGGYAYGCKIEFESDGEISALRFWRAAALAGTSRVLKLWGGTTLVATSEATTETATAGWVTAPLTTPVAVTENQQLMVSYEVPPGSPGGFNSTSPASTAALTFISASYGTFGAQPTVAVTSANYFVDLAFEPAGVADTDPPTAPTGLTATVVSAHQITLSWAAATDNVGVTVYYLERCEGADCTGFAEVAAPTGTTFPNTGLDAETVYRYRVRACDAAGNDGPYSGIATATTHAAAAAGGGLVAIVEALAAALEPLRADIPDLQIYPYWLAAATPPTIDIYPGDPFQNGLAFNGGAELFFTVRARVTTADSEAGQKLLYQILEPETGITAALEADQTLGGAVDSLSIGAEGTPGVSGLREYVEDVAVNGRLLGAEWRVRVLQ